MVTGVAVTAVESAVPPAVFDQGALWNDYFAAMFAGDERAERIWRSSGVRTRRGVIDPRVEDVASWGTDARMRRFMVEAPPLAAEAVSKALASAGVAPDDVGLFAAVSCTGYATPGLDITVASELGMGATVRRLSIGHMGCYAALPGLGAVNDFVVAHRRPAVVLCCELTSLHVQPRRVDPGPGGVHRDEVQQIVAHALFADAAAAAVVVPGGRGLELLDVVAQTDPTTSDYMSWDVTDLGFRMGLSPRVPAVLARYLRPVVDRLLAAHGLTVRDVAAWAVHPGGPRILDVAADSLGLDAAQLADSSAVLRDYGNCSSATVLLVLERVLAARRPSSGEHVVMLAFGPGLTLYAGLLRMT